MFGVQSVGCRAKGLGMMRTGKGLMAGMGFRIWIGFRVWIGFRTVES